MRLLVCGGRFFDDVPRLWALLDAINARRIEKHEDGVRCLIDGGQQRVLPDGRIVGADYWAHQWALARDVPTERFFANWTKFGNSAGPRRNRQMMAEGKPDAGLAMPGGRGTADMVSVLKDAGIKVKVLER